MSCCLNLLAKPNYVGMGEWYNLGGFKRKEANSTLAFFVYKSGFQPE